MDLQTAMVENGIAKAIPMAERIWNALRDSGHAQGNVWLAKKLNVERTRVSPITCILTRKGLVEVRKSKHGTTYFAVGSVYGSPPKGMTAVTNVVKMPQPPAPELPKSFPPFSAEEFCGNLTIVQVKALKSYLNALFK